MSAKSNIESCDFNLNEVEREPSLGSNDEFDLDTSDKQTSRRKNSDVTIISKMILGKDSK